MRPSSVTTTTTTTFNGRIHTRSSVRPTYTVTTTTTTTQTSAQLAAMPTRKLSQEKSRHSIFSPAPPRPRSHCRKPLDRVTTAVTTSDSQSYSGITGPPTPISGDENSPVHSNSVPMETSGETPSSNVVTTTTTTTCVTEKQEGPEANPAAGRHLSTLSTLTSATGGSAQSHPRKDRKRGPSFPAIENYMSIEGDYPLEDAGPIDSRKIIDKTLAMDVYTLSHSEILPGSDKITFTTPTRQPKLAFRFLRVLGEGTYGSVYLVRCGEHNKALKVFRSDSPRGRENFEEEMRIHRHLCKGEYRNRHLMASFYFARTLQFDCFFTDVAICDLEHLIVNDTIWSYRAHSEKGIGAWIYEPRVVFMNLLGALEALRKSRLVHRDVKCANILVYPDRLVLGDFSLSSVVNRRNPASLFNPCCTVMPYRPPECLSYYVRVLDVEETSLEHHTCKECKGRLKTGRPALDEESIDGRAMEYAQKQHPKREALGSDYTDPYAVDLWSMAVVMMRYLDSRFATPSGLCCLCCALEDALSLSTGEFSVTDETKDLLFKNMQMNEQQSYLDALGLTGEQRSAFYQNLVISLSVRRKVINNMFCTPDSLVAQVNAITFRLRRMLHHEPARRPSVYEVMEEVKNLLPSLHPLSQ